MISVSNGDAKADEDCDFGSGGIGCRVIIDPVPDRTVRVGPAPDDRTAGWASPLVWRRTFVGNFYEGDAGMAGCAGRPDDVPLTVMAAMYVIELVNTATGQVVELYTVCVWRQDDPPPEPPPTVLQPPTLGEFIDAHRQVLTVETQIDPDPVRSSGLTGLETWLWCEDPGSTNLTLELRGWTAEATVTPTQYSWAITGANPTATFTSPACGSQPQPAASWTPETKGTHTVDLSTRWEGVWTLAWNGIPVGAFPLGPVTLDAEPLGYPVLEYRGVLEGEE